MWTARLIKYNQEAIKAIWEGRNGQLHNMERIRELEGIPLLKEAIIEEYGIGLGLLPASEFSKYFRYKLPTLLQKQDDHLKHWLMVIRQARILMDSNNVLQDEFTTSKALQQWIGLSITVTEKEGTEILNEAIDQEYNLGLRNLPQQFNEYFIMTKQEIVQEELEWKNNWYCDIREARDKFDSANLINDSFTYPGVQREWVDLC